MRLGDLVELRTDHLGAAGLDGRLGPGDLVPGQHRVTPSVSPPSATVDPRALAFAPGDLLMSAVRPGQGRLWLADRSGTCTPEILVLRPRVHPGRAFVALAHPDTLAAAARLAHGGRLPRLRGPDLDRIEAPDPLSDAAADVVLSCLHRLAILHARDAAEADLLRTLHEQIATDARPGPRLGDVATVRSSLRRGRAPRGPSLHTGDLPRAGLAVHSQDRARLEGTTTPVVPGDVLVVALRPVDHRIGLAAEGGPASASAEILALDVDPAHLGSVVGWLLHPATCARLARLASGTRVPRLPRASLLEQRLPDVDIPVSAPLLRRARTSPSRARALRDLLSAVILGG